MGPLQTFQCFLDVREGVTILLGSHIQLPKVYAKVETTVLFPDKDDHIAPGLLLGLIAPACNMSFTCVLTSSSNGGRMHLNHSLKGSSSVTDIVLDLAGTPQLIVQGENVMILHQQFVDTLCLFLGPLVQA